MGLDPVPVAPVPVAPIAPRSPVLRLAAGSDLPGHRTNGGRGGPKPLLTWISREEDSTMSTKQVLEKGQEVTVPTVGKLLRVEQLTHAGEVLGVEYRRPADPKSSAIDHTLTFVVFVTAANAFIAEPRLA